MLNKNHKVLFFLPFLSIYLLFEICLALSQTTEDIKDFINAGVTLYNQKKLNDALIEFENVLLLDPNNFEAQLWIAKIFIDKKDFLKARSILYKLSKTNSNHSQVNALLELINKSNSKNRIAQESNSNHVAFKYNNKQKRGLVVPEMHVKRDENLSFNLLEDNQDSKANSNDLSAFEVFENLLKSDDPIDQIIETLKEEGIKAALDKYFNLVFSKPELISHNDKGLLKRGLDEFLPALEKNPQNYEARYYVGIIFYLNGQILDAYNILLPIKENSLEYFERIKHIFADLERKKVQEESNLALLKKSQNNKSENDNENQLNSSSSEKTNVRQNFPQDVNSSSDLQSGENKDFTQEGYDLYKKGHLDQSIELFNKAIQAKPNDSKAFYYLGLAYTDKALTGDIESYDKALEAFNKVLQLEPAESKLSKDSDLMIKDILQARQLLSR